MKIQEMQSATVEKKTKTIKVCLPGTYYPFGFIQGLINLFAYGNQNGIRFDLLNNQGSNIHELRQGLIRAVIGKESGKLEFFNGADYDYSLWIDSDQVWTNDDVDKLIKADKEIISASILRKKLPELAASYWYDKDGNRIGDIKMEGNFMTNNLDKCVNIKLPDLSGREEPMEVDGLGFGMILIKKGVFETLDFPFFRQAFYKAKTGYTGFFSEDYSFSVYAKAAGYKLYIHPKVLVGHTREETIYPKIS